MKGGVLLAVALCSTAAVGQTRTLSVAAGSCRDTDLVQVQAAFSDALKARLTEDAVDTRALLSSIRPASTLSLEELERLVESGKSRFYGGQHEPALAQLTEAIEGLEKSAPSPRAWKALSTARVLQGLVLRATKKKEPSAEAFRRILRVVPAHALDANEYSPSTVAAFEAVRKELKGAKRFPVSVLSQPPGADVFLDGAPVGKTPYSGTLPAGSYALNVGASFPRTLKVDREASAQVDLTFEASVAPQLPLCVEGTGEEAVSRAVKLGAHAQANNVVLLRLAPREGQPDWIEAVLYRIDTGARLRAGGMRLVASRQSGALDALATYVLTGQGKSTVVATSDAPVTKADKPKPEPLSGTPTRPLAEQAQPEAQPPPVYVMTPPPPRGGGRRIAGVALLAAGVGAGAAGLAVYSAGGLDRELLIALLDPDGNLPPEGAQGRDEALALKPKVEGNTVATVILCAGGGALAITGALLAFITPADAPKVSAIATPDGAALTLSGRF
jgi:hypothetical protein